VVASHLIQSCGSGQPAVEVDPLGGDAELGQALALGGEVLLVGGRA
jgi:hypothetical protein